MNKLQELHFNVIDKYTEYEEDSLVLSQSCTEITKSIAIEYQKWCISKKSMEYFKNNILWGSKSYTYQELFNLFIEEKYAK